MHYLVLACILCNIAEFSSALNVSLSFNAVMFSISASSPSPNPFVVSENVNLLQYQIDLVTGELPFPVFVIVLNNGAIDGTANGML